MSEYEYEEYDRLLADVKDFLKKSETDKKAKIQELAKKLDELGHKKQDIAKKIAKDLEGYTPSRSYVYQCLDEEYKREYDRYQESEMSKVDFTDIQEQNELEKPIVVATDGSSETTDDKYGKGVVPVTDEPNNDQYDKELTERYEAHLKEFDELAEKFNGLQAHNEYLEEMNKELKLAVDALQAARVPASTTQSDMKQHTPSHRGYWIRFDTTNIELTRPLINIINRARDRPKQFFIEVMDDEVIEISENRPAQ